MTLEDVLDYNTHVEDCDTDPAAYFWLGFSLAVQEKAVLPSLRIKAHSNDYAASEMV